ncbi:L,D-transpeptidase family protein [Coralliovum pocilloporae]|uniref:L,D-transpeptidase family protein n=1 Tax=Coralliovum pocilloporae TaxID=3066369 RepID=UPI003306CDD7
MRISISLLLAGAMLWSYPALAAQTPQDPATDIKAEAVSETSGETTVDVTPVEPVDPFSVALEEAFKGWPKAKTLAAKKDLAGLKEHYTQNSFKPLWIEDGKLSMRARKLIFFLSRAGRDGLNPEDYKTPSLSIGKDSSVTLDELARAELELSLAIVTYARHAQAGRLKPTKVSKSITLVPVSPDPLAVIDQVSSAEKPEKSLHSFQPQQDGYKRLREQLAKFRTLPKEKTPIQIAPGKALKLGSKGKRVEALRERLNVAATEENTRAVFDEALLKAVKEFQKNKDLHVDGIVGRRTLAILNGKKTSSEADLIANMEMWRWMPRDLGRFHVFVNVPEYRLRVYKDGSQTHTTRVVVGKFRNKTPIFSDEMEHVVVNPYWNVPASIAVKELLPKIRRDPRGYLAKRNYQVLTRVKGRTRVVDPRQINWSKFNAGRVRIRQAPGGRNALGRIKFLFPNKHAVYLHDTPSKSLFSRQRRAFSHGCIRVHNPFEFAEALFAEDKDWNSARLRSMLGNKERWVNLDKHVPVHLAYFTIRVNDDGDLNTFDDIYGHIGKLKVSLGL